jgi:transmembrane protein TMEM174 (potassium channel)
MSRAQAAKWRTENEIEFSRIVAFSDGVFAIAITLLVLNLGVPEHIRHDDLWPVLQDQGQDLFAYGLSFAVIGRFWVVHTPRPPRAVPSSLPPSSWSRSRWRSSTRTWLPTVWLALFVGPLLGRVSRSRRPS